MKIVSLLPSATEIVYALGLEDSLQGVTYECDFPEAARGKPVISNTALPREELGSSGAIDAAVREKMEARQPIYLLDRERIREIQPDLILAQDLCRVCAVPSGQVEEALDELGCTSQVLSLDPSSVDEIIDGIAEVGRATGRDDRARQLVEGLRARVEVVRSAAEPLPRVRTFAIEWLDPPFVGGHWVPEMVRLAGGQHLLNAERAPSRVASRSDIVRAGPEVVVFMPCGYGLEEAIAEAKLLLANEGFATTPAARGGAVFAVDATSYFSRPGPRIVDGLEILAWILHPEAFPEPGEGRAVRVVA